MFKIIKFNIKKLLILLVFLAIILTSIDINSKISNKQWYINLNSNMKFISSVIKTFSPILILMVLYIFYRVFSKKWVFRVEKLSLGGFNIIFDNPEKLFRQHVKNLLNTKRTIFKIDENNDNFYETLNSYYDVYNFLREEMKLFDPKTAEQSDSYSIANNMVQHLNDFLTKYQNNFRRWYDYMMEGKKEEIYNEDISNIQKQYRNYKDMVKGFRNLNKFFCSVSKKFDIDTSKWFN